MFKKIKKIRDERLERIRQRNVAEKIGHSGLNDFVRYLKSPWRVMWSNFIAGVFRGLGFVVGATVLLTLAVYILVRILGNLPWVGEWFQNAGGFLEDIRSGAESLQEIGR